MAVDIQSNFHHLKDGVASTSSNIGMAVGRVDSEVSALIACHYIHCPNLLYNRLKTLSMSPRHSIVLRLLNYRRFFGRQRRS